MGRPSPLGDEDRSAYAEVVDEVLASAEFQRLLEASGVSGGRLRIRALAAVGRTAPAAAAEYRAYAALRRTSHGRRGDGGPAPLSGPGHQERPGAGALAVLGVLTPILAAVAGATFLLLGYGLRLTDSMAALADTLVRVGWISLAIAAATSLISLVAVYRTAARLTAGGGPFGRPGPRPGDLAHRPAGQGDPPVPARGTRRGGKGGGGTRRPALHPAGLRGPRPHPARPHPA
ncbi:hypothetical protein [Streptomyces cyaneofuscatus]|uniref:hypothetical protein n=1 Tax=Streptomyces cyaneofuscatus TaxID=66883 RepID=UPI00342E6984